MKIKTSILALSLYSLLTASGCSNEKLEGEVSLLRSENTRLQVALTAADVEREQLRQQVKQLTVAAQDQRTKQRGELSGTVTYYFNENYGYKPDTGSRVFVIAEGTPSFDPGKLKKYCELRLEAEIDRPGAAQAFANISHDRSIIDMIDDAAIRKTTLRMAVDGNGGFKAPLKPGRYCVVIQSSHLHGDSSVDMLGLIDCKEIDVTDGDQVNVDAAFRN